MKDKKHSGSINVVGNIYPSGHEAGNVHDADGISPTLKCNGPRANFKKASPLIIQKIRNDNYTVKENTTGTLCGGGMNPTDKVPNIIVKSNTKKGFEEAKEGDSINLSMPKSKTRRGRVGVGVAQTLDTQVNQATIIEGNIRRLTEIECERLQGFPDNWTKFGIFDERPNRKDLLLREQDPELWAYHTKMVGENVTVREISRTQRYKLVGNAVTVSIVALIGRKLLKK